LDKLRIKESDPNVLLSFYCCFSFLCLFGEEFYGCQLAFQNDFCLLWKLIKISNLLSMGAVQTCASSQYQSNVWMTLLKKLENHIYRKNHI